MPTTVPRLPRRLALAGAATVAACGGSDISVPASIGLSMSQEAISVAQAASGALTVSTSRTNFSSDITLSAEGVPAGVTVSFAPAVLTGSAAQSSATVAVSTAAVVGRSTITVRAHGAGVSDRTATMALTVLPAPAYTLALSASSVAVSAGGNTNVGVALARTNFTGAVTIVASGLPVGASATVAPSPTTTDGAVLTIRTGTAATGTYPLVITGTALGLTDRTVALTLTITESSYTLAPASPTVAVEAGVTVSLVLAVNRAGFTGDVSLAHSGLPAGATATFSPNPVSSSAAVLSIVTGSASPGSYPVTITGTAAGLPNRTATVTLTITPGGASSNVRFAFCADALPTWVGYQSGTGAWQQASAGAGNVYAFAIAGRGGVAVVAPMYDDAFNYGYQTTIHYASAAELESIGSGYCGASGPVGNKTVNGTVSGSAAAGSQIVLGSAAVDTRDGPFTLKFVAAGARDLLATTMSSSSGMPVRMVIRRNLDPVNGSTLAPIDFAGSEPFVPVTPTLLLTGVAAGTPVTIVPRFTTANGSSIALGYEQVSGGSASYVGVPAAIAGDLHDLFVYASYSTGFRGSLSFFTTASSRTVTIGPLLSPVAVSSLGSTPYLRLRAQFASQAEYGSLAFASFSRTSEYGSSADRAVGILVTPAYLAGAPTTWDLSIPDLAAAAGFSGAWMLGPGPDVDVFTSAYGGDVLLTTPVNGTVFRFASHYATTTAPASLAPTAVRLSRTVASVPAAETANDRIRRLVLTRTALRRR